MKTVRHVLTINDLTKKDVLEILSLARKIKKTQRRFAEALYEKVLVMMFEKPSLRTRLSFDIAMTQLGGHAIFYDTSHSPLHEGKESLADTARVMSRMCNCIMARTYSHEHLMEFASYSTVPVINGLTDFSHPCQIISDLFTIYEKKKTYSPSVAYYGDCQTNVAHSWMFAAKLMGFQLFLVCPPSKKYTPLPQVYDTTAKNVTIIPNPHDVPATDVVYTDSWMSYNIPKWQQHMRVKTLRKYQVTPALMKRAKKNAIFMHDLPALRGMEVHADVIDGKQSIVIDQAENRLHAEKGIVTWLLK